MSLNVHFHLLVLDGVYRRYGEGGLRFVPVAAPSTVELNRPPAGTAGIAAGAPKAE